MPLTLRSSTDLPVSVLLEVEQIVVIDQTPPGIVTGPGPGLAIIIGETLKGPFEVTEVTSEIDLLNQFGGVSEIMSQSDLMVQDGSGERFEGNVMVALRNLAFTRIGICRVDTEATTTDAGATKAVVTLTIDDNALVPVTPTTDEYVIPAGTRLADDVIGAATFVVATSEDVTIPKGTALPAVFTAKVFVVKGHPSAAIAAIDTVIDSVIPNAPVTTVVDSVTNLTAIFPAAATAALGSLTAKTESKYLSAINMTVPGNDPADDITVLWSARRGLTAAVIRTPLEQNQIDSSKFGRGRICIVSGPKVGTATGDAATAAAAKTATQNTTTTESPGRLDRKIVTFPYSKKYIPEFSRNVDIAPDSWMASTLSNFPSEVNPGARNEFIQTVVAFEDAYAAAPLTRTDYVNFKANGVAALRRDRSVGWQFQSGVTSVDPLVDPARAPIKRRRMADEIQDTLTGIATKYSKGPATTAAIDSFVGEVSAYLNVLDSPNNPSSERIVSYSIDPTSGNTPELLGLGIFTLIVKVRLLASLDTIVYSTQIGETVTP